MRTEAGMSLIPRQLSCDLADAGPERAGKFRRAKLRVRARATRGHRRVAGKGTIHQLDDGILIDIPVTRMTSPTALQSAAFELCGFARLPRGRPNREDQDRRTKLPPFCQWNGGKHR